MMKQLKEKVLIQKKEKILPKKRLKKLRIQYIKLSDNYINTLNNPEIHPVENNLHNNNSFNPYKTSTGFRPYNKRLNFKDTYDYENKTRFKSKVEKYLYIINSMKKIILMKMMIILDPSLNMKVSLIRSSCNTKY